MTNRVAPAAAILILVSTLALVGCTPQTSAPQPTPSASVPEVIGEPTSEPTFSATCDAVLTPEALYEYNPNVALDADFVPAEGSMAARLTAAGGVACGWVNLTSGTYIVAAVAEPDAAALASLESEVAAVSSPTDAFGAKGYFAVANGTGEAVAFENGAVFVVSGVELFEPADAVALVEAAASVYAG